MPMKWDDRARTTLLLKLIEQNPNILSSVSADAVAANWPGSPKPTGRAIIEQIKVLKKESGVPSTPSSKRVTNNVPRTPKTPTTIKTPSTKRSTASAHTGSAAKKRKFTNNKKKVSDDESEEEPELSSSVDDNADDNEESETDSPTRAPTTRIKRRLPTRCKSRKISYIAEVDSAGEDEAAKASCSDYDETFSLEALEQGKGKGKTKLKMDKLNIEKHIDEEDQEANEGMDIQGGDDQECEDDSDEGSEATNFHSARDCVV